MRIPQIFTLIPGFYVDPKSQLTTILPQKNKKHRQSSDYQCLQPVGVTGFEPATTRPPDFKDYGLIMSDYQELSFFFCFLVYTMVYNSVNCCC